MKSYSLSFGHVVLRDQNSYSIGESLHLAVLVQVGHPLFAVAASAGNCRYL